MSLDIAFSPLALPRLGNAADTAQWEQARRRGHSSGYAEGRRLAGEEALLAEAAVAQRRQEQAQDLAESAQRGLVALEQAKAAVDDHSARLAEIAEARVIELAVELAEAIIGAEMSDPVQSALNAASRASRTAVSHPDAVVVLNPADLATLDGLGEIPEGITFESSTGIHPGDAVVKLPDGEVDLQVTSALRRVRDTIEQVRP